MAKEILTLDTIGDLDEGRARLAVNRELDRAVADLLDRGTEDGKTRKVVIQLELTTKEGLIVCQVQAQAKLPPLKSGATAAETGYQKGKEVLAFQELAPHNPDQQTFPEMDKKPDEQ